MTASTYSDYLCLPQILSAQHTLSDSPVLQSSEHFFIVVHQAAELWLKQAIVDLEQASGLLRGPDRAVRDAIGQLMRVATALDLLTASTQALDLLSIDHFTRLRPLLGTASGAQSAQYRRLAALLGLPAGEGLVWNAFEEYASRRDQKTSDLCGGDVGDGHDVVEALATIALSAQRWQQAHLRLVEHMLGTAPGTGGTTGAAFLRKRLGLAFPRIWDARGAVDRENAS